MTALKEGVERVEKFFLGPLFLGEKLDVINQQRIYRTVEPLELVYRVELKCFNHVSHKALGVQIHNFGVGVLF